jgi:septal ring factor EnvC (AmiA/AmiB activator)
LKAFFALLLAASLFMGATAPRSDLEGMRKKIESEKKGLSELAVKEGSVRQSLGKIESELGKRNRELKAANAKLSSILLELASRQARAEELDRSLALRREVLRRRAVALYRWRRHGSTLIFLSGAASLSGFLQRKRYLQATLAYDQQLLAQLSEESQRLALARQELDAKKAELDSQKQALGAAQEAVRREAEKKKALLVSLRREKETRSKQLRAMEVAAARLQRMLDDLSRRAAVKPGVSPPAPSTGVGLDAMRGRLDWPVKGAVSAPFGKFTHPEFAAEIIRKGIDIEATRGEPIKAVERGRVVYAGHFSGYGNMVIVDHGERYYTIYGHLADMLKKNGDEVGRGEALGRVGASESMGGAKIYFEMRKDGRSVDPLTWLKKP